MYCSMCGAKLSDDDLFCTNCGHEINRKPENNPENEDKLISNSSDEINKKSKDSNKYILIGLVIVIIILIAGISFIMIPAPLPEVTYENYPDISKDVIDDFNKWDVNNDSLIGSNEYGAHGYSVVWTSMEDEGYVNHTVRYNDKDIPAMDINDYNNAYEFEQKEIKKEYDKRKAINDKNNADWEQAYQNWYSRHGDSSLSDSQNRQRFQLDVSNRAYRMVYGGFGF